MKTVFLLIAIAIAAYFLYFKNSDEPQKKTSPKAKTTATTKSKKNSAKKAASEKYLITDYPADSLAKKIIALQDKKFSDPLFPHINNNFNRGLDLQNAKTIIEKNQNILQEVRNLSNCTILGEKYDKGPEQLLPWLNGCRYCARWLLTSAEVNAANGKNAAAKQDFSAMAKIISIVATGDSCILQFLVIAAVDEMYRISVKRCNLSQQEKQECLNMLPDRTKYTAFLRTSLNTEKRILLLIQQMLKDDDGDTFNLLAADIKEKIKNISSNRLTQLIEKYNDQVCNAFADGTLHRGMKFNVGSAQENTFISDLIPLNGIIKLSERLK